MIRFSSRVEFEDTHVSIFIATFLYGIEVGVNGAQKNYVGPFMAVSADQKKVAMSPNALICGCPMLRFVRKRLP